jgi:hypothetical protein
MRRGLALVAALGAVLSPVAAAKPVLTVKGHLEALAASGSYAALATAAPGTSCTILLVSGSAKRQITGPTPCQRGSQTSTVVVSQLWIGSHTLMAEAIASPSPHGDSYSLWTAPLGGSAVTEYGDAWGWNDSAGDTPSGVGSIGCAYYVTSGGGVIPLASGPTVLGTLEVGGSDVDTCLPAADASTHLVFVDGPSAGADVTGAWKPLATDGSRVLLEALGSDGQPTGALSLAALDGTTSAAPPVPPGFARQAVGGWLAPEGLVLESGNRVAAWPVHGRNWSVSDVNDAAVGNGRLVYSKGRVVRVRRIAGGHDRPLLVLPVGSNPMVATGSFGVAVAAEQRGKTSLYRIPWKNVP